MTRGDFEDFLSFRHNKHWTGLDRHKTALLSDMPKLLDTISKLVDHSQPIAQRVDDALTFEHLGIATISPILLLSKPNAFGVWNGVSQKVMQASGLWPVFPRASSKGEQYHILNKTLLALAKELSVDLWTLDALWWGMAKEEAALSKGQSTTPVPQHIADHYESDWDKALKTNKAEILSADAQRRAALSKARPGQQKFREAAMARHQGRCVVTGCRVSEALEAAHVIPHTGEAMFERPDNSLILRRDLHALFDASLIAITERNGMLKVHPMLQKSAYGQLVGRAVNYKLADGPLRYQEARFNKRLSED
ncbi:HNH endonuclease signature motif containing protein [Mesobacterium pallidum]|uniref:HNH endonuclease signature motif containing protein n=1 Tax=Mesobacterium pallidum TaxID=2872037 RepID=UPI001EE1BDB7|nr:HNH endonuclease signature motif containing protein [Mesobacterium pallidum]